MQGADLVNFDGRKMQNCWRTCHAQSACAVSVLTTPTSPAHPPTVHKLWNTLFSVCLVQLGILQALFHLSRLMKFSYYGLVDYLTVVKGRSVPFYLISLSFSLWQSAEFLIKIQWQKSSNNAASVQTYTEISWSLDRVANIQGHQSTVSNNVAYEIGFVFLFCRTSIKV